MRGSRVFLKIIGVCLGGLLVVAVFLEIRYNFLFAAPRIAGEAVAPPRASFQLRIEPDLVKDYLARRYAAGTPVPERFVPYLLPYEIGLYMDPDLATAQTEIGVFVNARRLGPIIAQRVNQSGVLARIPDIVWSPPELTRPRRGLLRLEGSMPVTADKIDLVREVWGIVTPLSPLPMMGGHALEAILDMRDGRGFVLAAEWIGKNAPPETLLHPTQIVPIAKNIAEARILADMESDNTLCVKLLIECRPEVPDSEVNSLCFLMNYITAHVKPNLKSICDVELTGTAEAEGLRVSGEYRLVPMDNLLSALGLH